MVYRLSELGRLLGAELRGDGDVEIERVAPLNRAGPRDIAYCASFRYRSLIAGSGAGALILNDDDAKGFTGNMLVCADPRAVFARAAALLHPRALGEQGHHHRAVIAPTAQVDPTAYIDACAVVDDGAIIGAHVRIGAGVFIGARTIIGESTWLDPRAVIMHDCVVGRRCHIGPGAVIGGEGFGYVREPDATWLKVPQLGCVIVGDDVDIGANTTIDRGALGDTVIANGVKLDNLIQIGHNVKIGENTAMAGCVGVAGSAVIGRRCMIAGGAGIVGHITVGDDVEVTAMSFLKGSVEGPGRFSSSLPATSADAWARNVGRLRHLDELARRLRRVEQALKQILSGGKS